jgi:hypothetical protein
MELSSASTAGAVSPQAYANLIKASWILIDIIASHPQVTFLKSSAQYEVQALSSVSGAILQETKIRRLLTPNPKGTETGNEASYRTGR